MRELQTIKTRIESGVLFATFDAPPMNLIGIAMTRDLVDLCAELERDDEVVVVVFDSADPEFFLPHIDVTEDYPKETRRIGGPAGGSLGGLFRRLSEARQITIAQIEGITLAAGSEFALACDMRFASRERASFCQIEVGIGAMPGAGAVQHLTRLMGRGRAMEAILSSGSYDGDMVERYGWVNRAIPQSELAPFVTALALRIAKFPMPGLIAAKRRINDVSLPQIGEVNTDAALFAATFGQPRAMSRAGELMKAGMQTRGELERDFATGLGRLTS